MIVSPYRAHPWHGIASGEDAPEVVNAFIEIVPTDTVKYEIDKVSGHLMIDRPQKYSNFCPVPYGLVPRTLCGERVAEFAMKKTGRENVVGDLDPIDICVFTERPINHASVLVKARPIGGLQMFDGNEADDKIIAVLDRDLTYGRIENIDDLPHKLINRLRHYFLTYKQMPEDDDNEARICEILGVYGADDAKEMVKLAMEDYAEKVTAKNSF